MTVVLLGDGRGNSRRESKLLLGVAAVDAGIIESVFHPGYLFHAGICHYCVSLCLNPVPEAMYVLLLLSLAII
jgi:hypothetical protein